jgi:hypothetical protein
LYNEIVGMDDFPNYKGAKILGYCLNVMGLEIGDKADYGSEYYPLRKVVLAWTKRNYMQLREDLPDVAEACLLGSITFDEGGNRLVKTFAKGLRKQAPEKYLDLDPVVLPSD